MELKDIIIFIAIITIIIGFLYCIGSLMKNEARTIETLDKAGFTDIVITGIGPLDCSEDDYIRTRFEATNPQEIRIQGTVCCGIFKRCTIRY